MKIRLVLLVVGTSLLSACASPGDNGCNKTLCRPLSENHSLTVWWPSDIRSGVQDYSQVSVGR
ncbi:type III secretion protein HrpT [[Pantoea] beijingensis]|uniref:Type III secretion protein HrpT n=1 Tax=[Pantoea] beijingensis TaxID=1324864 RepID=A0A443IAI0_9GAMM|nr:MULTISPECIES: HrpT family type III secretion system protein [Erwiniaceae]RWR00990.1 type III secretion protein HrpT [[Pantoea] beijingensis]